MSLDLQSSVFYTGLMKLLADAGTALTIISPIVGGVAVAYFFIRRSAGDEMDNKKWTNRINIAIISGIAGALGGALIKVVGSYFGVS